MIMSKIIQNRKLGSVNQKNKTFGESLSGIFCHTFKKTVSKNSKSGYKTKVSWHWGNFRNRKTENNIKKYQEISMYSTRRKKQWQSNKHKVELQILFANRSQTGNYTKGQKC